HGRRVAAAEPPRDEDERSHTGDSGEREKDDARLDAPLLPGPRPRSAATRAEELLSLDDVARVVLVDIELAVQSEVLRVVPQEPLHVRLRGEHVELLLLERTEVLAANLGRLLDLGEIQVLAQARFPQAVADLEHAGRP